MNFYQIISRKQIEDSFLIFHDIANKFRATAANQAKNSKSSWLIKDSFDFSFASEDAKPVSEKKDREKAKKWKKKKSKTNKKLTKDVDFSIK